MKIAVIGSRNLNIENIEQYLPEGMTEIVSGGARGVDSLAREYALAHQLPFKEFLPDYARYRRAAPLRRNISIIEYADAVVALWDGKSRGTDFVIRECEKRGVPCAVYLISPKEND